jgi:hypothetical protein
MRGWRARSALPIGAVRPLLAILLPPGALRVPGTFAAVLVALALTGGVGAHLGVAHAARLPSVLGSPVHGPRFHLTHGRLLGAVGAA